MFELADIERDPAERRRLLTFFVAGGGYAGTEIAGELADFVRLLTKREYSGIRRDECRVVLVHPGPTLLPELYGSQSTEGQGRGKSYAKLVEYATRHARKLGVELLLETRVAGATPLEVYLSNGEHVPTRTIVSAVGTKAPPLFDTIELPRDERGRVRTDACLRVEGFENVWAGGDCAAVPHPDGGTCPPVGIYALKHGARIGKNLRRVARGQAAGAVPLPGARPGRVDRPPHRGRRAEGHPDPRPLLLDRLALDALLLLPDLGPAAAAARRLVDLAARRPRHRPARPGRPRRVRDPPPRLPARPGDRRAGAAGAPRARDRRGRGRARRPATEIVENLRSRRPLRPQVDRALAARTRRARGRSSARSRCAPTRRTSCRTCCSRRSGSWRARGRSRRSGPRT